MSKSVFPVADASSHPVFVPNRESLDYTVFEVCVVLIDPVSADSERVELKIFVESSEGVAVGLWVELQANKVLKFYISQTYEQIHLTVRKNPVADYTGHVFYLIFCKSNFLFFILAV